MHIYSCTALKYMIHAGRMHFIKYACKHHEYNIICNVRCMHTSTRRETRSCCTCFCHSTCRTWWWGRACEYMFPSQASHCARLLHCRIRPRPPPPSPAPPLPRPRFASLDKAQQSYGTSGVDRQWADIRRYDELDVALWVLRVQEQKSSWLCWTPLLDGGEVEHLPLVDNMPRPDWLCASLRWKKQFARGWVRASCAERGFANALWRCMELKAAYTSLRQSDKTHHGARQILTTYSSDHLRAL